MSDLGRPPLALVTGASSGIGRELAAQLLERGFEVLGVAENIGDGSAVEALGPGFLPLRADLATVEGNDAVVGWLDEDGRVPVIAALNAGIGVGGPFLDRDVEDHVRLVRLNVESTVRLAHAVGNRMVARASGRILITSSIASQMPGPLNGTYAASKSFVQSLAVALHEELAPRGVRVTALLPGPTDTEFFERAGLEHTRIGEGSKDDPADVARDGLEALDAGRTQVVAGSWTNAVQAALADVVPDRAKAMLHGRLNAPRR